MQKTINILSAILLTGSLVQAAVINVNSLNERLKKNSATWVAKDNWVNQLTKTEARRMMGVKTAPSQDVEFISPLSLTAKTGLPSSIDWRNKDGKNWVSPMLNQANCGSCVAFAAVGVMETQFNIASAFPNLNIRFSPQNLFACGGGGCDTGWWPSSAAQRLMSYGVPDEACMPYTSGATGQDVACSASCSDTQARSRKIAGYKTPNRNLTSLVSVKEALQKGPVMTTLTVYSDFVAYAGGVYKHTSGEMLGGHAISIIGYDDADQAFIIRNSWGEDWGEKGFGRVAYSDTSGVGRQTWGFEVPAVSGAVSIVSPRDYTYVTGRVDFKVQSTYPMTDSVAVTVYDINNKAVWASNCTASDCTGVFDSQQLKDGRYEVQATALNSKGDKIDVSTREFFYVVNTKPMLSLSFQGHNVDLDQPLSERIEFDITTTTTNAPFSSLEFHFKNSAGVEKVRKAEVVLDHMTMGWRTNVLPNGSYEIWMVGKLNSNALDIQVETPHRMVNLKN